MLVGANPQFLIADPRLNILECRQHAGLEDIEPGGHMKTGNVDGAAEIVPRPEVVRSGVGDDLIEIGLPGGKIRVAGERQAHPVCRLDERRGGLARRLQACVPLRGRRCSRVQLRRREAEALPDGLAVRWRQAWNVLRHPQPQPFHLDRLPFADHVIVDAGGAHLDEEGTQTGVTLRRGGKRGGGAGRGSAGRASAS